MTDSRNFRPAAVTDCEAQAIAANHDSAISGCDGRHFPSVQSTVEQFQELIKLRKEVRLCFLLLVFGQHLRNRFGQFRRNIRPCHGSSVVVCSECFNGTHDAVHDSQRVNKCRAAARPVAGQRDVAGAGAFVADGSGQQFLVKTAHDRFTIGVKPFQAGPGEQSQLAGTVKHPDGSRELFNFNADLLQKGGNDILRRRI